MQTLKKGSSFLSEPGGIVHDYRGPDLLKTPEIKNNARFLSHIMPFNGPSQGFLSRSFSGNPITRSGLKNGLKTLLLLSLKLPDLQNMAYLELFLNGDRYGPGLDEEMGDPGLIRARMGYALIGGFGFWGDCGSRG